MNLEQIVLSTSAPKYRWKFIYRSVSKFLHPTNFNYGIALLYTGSSTFARLDV